MFTTTRTLTLLGMLVVALALGACTAVMPMATTPALPTPAAGELSLADVRVRAAPLEGGNSAAYLLVLNGRDEAVRLVSAASDVAGAVEIHETINDNGVMKMVPQPDGFEIPAGGVLELKPGGKHIMLLGLAAPLEAGQSVDLTLNFDTGEELKVTAPVVDLGMPMQMQEEGAMHGDGAAEGDMHAAEMAGAGAMEEGDHAAEGEHEHAAEHAAMGDHAAMMLAVPVAVKEAFEALPIDALHDMDETLAAGTIEPEFAATIEEFRTGMAAIEWPESIQVQIQPISDTLDELAMALDAGDTSAAAELAAKVHGLVHALEFTIEPPQ